MPLTRSKYATCTSQQTDLTLLSSAEPSLGLALRGREIMRKKRPILVAAIITALTGLAAPAYAVSPDECAGLGGTTGPRGECIVTADPTTCAALGGFPTRDETECIIPP